VDGASTRLVVSAVNVLLALCYTETARHVLVRNIKYHLHSTGRWLYFALLLVHSVAEMFVACNLYLVVQCLTAHVDINLSD